MERLPEGNAYLRAGWQDSRHFGFDSRASGSYVYADKTVPGEFILEDIDEESDAISSPSSILPASSGEAYDLSGRPLSPGYRGIALRRSPDGHIRKVLIP